MANIMPACGSYELGTCKGTYGEHVMYATMSEEPKRNATMTACSEVPVGQHELGMTEIAMGIVAWQWKHN